MAPPTDDRQAAGTASIAVAAMGVVYGDIGTSPLYTMKEVFTSAHHPVPVTPDNVIGILSLVFCGCWPRTACPEGGPVR
ncbi:MAG: KUP/HAK/KT family potassium transporter [Rhodocyclaceae bacterium]|nr:KUP/HAK/KT family potassium transporter [Rhodocyclaceae bacterium]